MAANFSASEAMTMVDRRDWPLLALAQAPDGKLTPVQLQKVLFLMAMEAHEEISTPFYNFVPYNYGPFDAAIYSDIEDNAREGLATIDKSGRWSTYIITPEGQRQSNAILREANPQAIEYLNQCVLWAKSLDFANLLRAIYRKYPAYAENSVFNG